MAEAFLRQKFRYTPTTHVLSEIPQYRLRQSCDQCSGFSFYHCFSKLESSLTPLTARQLLVYVGFNLIEDLPWTLLTVFYEKSLTFFIFF